MARAKTYLITYTFDFDGRKHEKTATFVCKFSHTAEIIKSWKCQVPTLDVLSCKLKRPTNMASCKLDVKKPIPASQTAPPAKETAPPAADEPQSHNRRKDDKKDLTPTVYKRLENRIVIDAKHCNATPAGYQAVLWYAIRRLNGLRAKSFVSVYRSIFMETPCFPSMKE